MTIGRRGERLFGLGHNPQWPQVGHLVQLVGSTVI